MLYSEINRMELKNVSLTKYLLSCIVGFGLGGILWGIILYQDRFFGSSSSFHYLSIFTVGIFGGIALSWFSKDFKTIVKSIIAGVLGQGVGYVTSILLVIPLALMGALILGVFLPVETADYFDLEPRLKIGGGWLVFFFMGSIIGLSYALLLKRKIWPMVWRGGAGFAFGSLIGPILGNLAGQLCGSLLISYLVTFFVMSVSLGTFLGYGTYLFGKTKIKGEISKTK